MRRSLLLLSVGLLAVGGPAWAGSVFLNGVNIDGVTNTKFEKATVRIDEQGNVFIDAPGYAAKVVEAPPATPVRAKAPSTVARAPEVPEPVNAKLTKRYWLVTEQSVPGMTEFDIDLYVNSKWVRKLRSDDGAIVTEVTKHLQPGKNTVLLSAHKVAAGPRKSFSPAHTFKVVIGEGNVGGNNVMIDTPVVKFQRNASEAEDVSEEFSFVTR